jgi:threonine/homoserine/homoserine lactone efflux protein
MTSLKDGPAASALCGILSQNPPSLHEIVWSSRGGNGIGKRGASGRTPPVSAVREGLINSLTNPEPLLLMFALLPQFVSPDQGCGGGAAFDAWG